MYTVSEIAGLVEDENLSEVILNLVSPSRVKDAELQEMFEDARDLLIRIQEYLDFHSGGDEDESEDWEE